MCVRPSAKPDLYSCNQPIADAVPVQTRSAVEQLWPTTCRIGPRDRQLTLQLCESARERALTEERLDEEKRQSFSASAPPIQGESQEVLRTPMLATGLCADADYSAALALAPLRMRSTAIWSAITLVGRPSASDRRKIAVKVLAMLRVRRSLSVSSQPKI